MHTACFKMF